MANIVASTITAVMSLITGTVLQIAGANGSFYFYLVGVTATVWTALLIRNKTRSKK